MSTGWAIGRANSYIGDTRVGGRFEVIVDVLLAGLDSAQSEATGWDAVVKASLAAADIELVSPTVVTLTLPAAPSYNITADETLTWTVPAAALESGSPIVATPTVQVTAGVTVFRPAAPVRVLHAVTRSAVH